MEDFNSFAKDNDKNASGQGQTKNLLKLVTSLAKKFDGKNQNELISAIYEEAKKGKQNGTLSNADLDNFAKTVSPFLDDKKRKMLYKIVEDLKRI